MIALATALHAIAAVIWVGGMFFAYMALRPAVAPLEPPARLALWKRTFDRFFLWVWLSIVLLLLTGYWMIFAELGGFANAGMHIHIMQGLGIIMMLLFFHLWFAPYRRLGKAVAANDTAAGAKQIGQIRMIVGTNLLLGIIVVVIGTSGRYWM